MNRDNNPQMQDLNVSKEANLLLLKFGRVNRQLFQLCKELGEINEKEQLDYATSPRLGELFGRMEASVKTIKKIVMQKNRKHH